MKRGVDILISLWALIILIPVMIIVFLWIKFESKGSAIFVQKRVGRNGSVFHMYKFRSMEANAVTNGPHFTKVNDSRITNSGKFIRRTSLDELPQLFNVLMGDMSLVGPRPNVPVQRDEYTEDEWTKRNTVHPGITGLAQATLRSEATPEERTRLDLEYVEQASFIFDIKIILLTIKQLMLKGSH